MNTPCGIEIKVGQQWKELDPRMYRTVTIVGIYPEMGRRPIVVRNNTNKRLSYNAVNRFNGKRGGYLFLPINQG